MAVTNEDLKTMLERVLIRFDNMESSNNEILEKLKVHQNEAVEIKRKNEILEKRIEKLESDISFLFIKNIARNILFFNVKPSKEEVNESDSESGEKVDDPTKLIKNIFQEAKVDIKDNEIEK